MTKQLFGETIKAIIKYELEQNVEIMVVNTIVQHMNNSYPRFVWHVKTACSSGNKCSFDLIATNGQYSTVITLISINGKIQHG